MLAAVHLRTIQLSEGSDAWRAWRHNGIGASDAPAIIGVSRYTDARALLLQKRAPIATAPPDDLRLARGRALEPIARRAVEDKLGVAIPPVCCQHDKHPELRASLDGWSEARRLPVEIKCPGHALHAEALRGRIPRRFLPQCLHILLVTGADRLLYASYQPTGLPPNKWLALVELASDPTLCDELSRIELEFWQSVQHGTQSPQFRLWLDDLKMRRVD